VRINDNPANATGFVETHVLPGLSGINRFVGAVPRDIAIPNGPGLSRAGPNNVWVRLGHGQRSDGRHQLVIKDSRKSVSAVCAFPDSARCCSRGIGIRIARYPGDGSYAITDERTQEPDLRSLPSWA
jgi:hypothetical protein